MAQELQQLLEKIQKEGVEKAEAEAAAILKAAEKKAAAIVKEAEDKAAASAAGAAANAKAEAERAEAAIRQAARDVVLETEAAITAKLGNLLAKDVDAALAAKAPELAFEAIKATGAKDAEIAADAKTVAALRAQLAAEAKDGVKLVTVEGAETGFSIKLDGGRVEHDFTAKAITEALARRLRPALVALVR